MDLVILLAMTAICLAVRVSMPLAVLIVSITITKPSPVVSSVTQVVLAPSTLV